MKTQVEANITDQLDYVKSILKDITGSEGIVNLNDNLSKLDWILPLYDNTQPSYNLIFKSVKAADTPDGLFTINHKATGDYISSTNGYGSLNDSVMASYGKIDKLIFTDNKSVTSKKDSRDYSFNLTSSNDTNDDTSDDYAHIVSYSDSISYGNSWKANTKYSDTYKSKDLNYSFNRTASVTVNNIDTGSNSETGKCAYTNHDIDLGSIVYANFVYTLNSKYSDNSENILLNFSSATLKIISDDKLNTSSLTFVGGMSFSDDETTNSTNISKFTLENNDLKTVSGAVPKILVGDKSVNYDLQSLQYLLDNEEIPQETITKTIDYFKTLNQGDNTITIKNSEGLSVDAGNGKDVVVGGKGNDTIIGGAGSDKLTGGKGSDTFSFNSADFFTENTNRELVYNKSVDTITDFNLSEKDVLNFGDLGELSFFSSLKDAIDESANLFYVSGKIYLNTNTDNSPEGKYTATPIITLTGNPKVNADLSDFAYPA